MKIKTDAELFEEREYERRFGDDPNPKLDRLQMLGLVKNEAGQWFQQIGDEFYELEQTHLVNLLKEAK